MQCICVWYKLGRVFSQDFMLISELVLILAFSDLVTECMRKLIQQCKA